MGIVTLNRGEDNFTQGLRPVGMICTTKLPDPPFKSLLLLIVIEGSVNNFVHLSSNPGGSVVPSLTGDEAVPIIRTLQNEQQEEAQDILKCFKDCANSF